MHTSKHTHTVFNHNSDFSGDVRICNIETNEEIWINGKDILDFVFENYVLPKTLDATEEHLRQQLNF